MGDLVSSSSENESNSYFIGRQTGRMRNKILNIENLLTSLEHVFQIA